MKVKVICDNKEEIIDNVIKIEQFMGDVTNLTDICGSIFTHLLCPDCERENNKNGCSKVFIIGRIKGDPGEVLVETPDKDYSFYGEDIEVKILDNLY